MSETVFFFEKENKGKVEKILKDDKISRLSIRIRESRSLGLEKDGFILRLGGPDEVLDYARENLREVAQELEGEEREKVLQKMREEEDSAASGLGLIFG